VAGIAENLRSSRRTSTPWAAAIAANKLVLPSQLGGASTAGTAANDTDQGSASTQRMCGGAWVWAGEAQRDRAAEILASLDCVEEVLRRDEAAARFLLDPTRMGDLAVLADRRSVFGDLATETEDLPPGYRSHGSAYERTVPLLRWNLRDPGAGPAPSMTWHLLLPLAGPAGEPVAGAEAG
jgi:hypothetical protein